MNPIVIWRTKNGYIVTHDKGYMSPEDIKDCHVFNTINQVSIFLQYLKNNQTKKKEKP